MFIPFFLGPAVIETWTSQSPCCCDVASETMTLAADSLTPVVRSGLRGLDILLMLDQIKLKGIWRPGFSRQNSGLTSVAFCDGANWRHVLPRCTHVVTHVMKRKP